MERLKYRDAFRRIDRLRLKDGEPLFQGDLFHAAYHRAFTTARTIRIGDQSNDGMPTVEQRPKSRFGKGSGSHHDNAHQFSHRPRAQFLRNWSAFPGPAVRGSRLW